MTKFRLNSGELLEVKEKYLTDFLSPSTKGTKYYDHPPSGALNERQKGRILLQAHQILSLFQSLGIELKGKNLLDLGTGNAMIPSLLLELSDLESAVGADPYLDGEHLSSWNQHDRTEAFQEMIQFLKKNCSEAIDFKNYMDLVGFEAFALRPSKIKVDPQPSKKFEFIQKGAHELSELNRQFDIIYCKAIEHVNDWPLVFKNLGNACKNNSVVYLKHRSFFSYLGAHRYASTWIPWGHVILKDEEYNKYVEKFHSDRAQKMKEFYYSALSYPRHSVSEMLKIAQKFGLFPISIVAEPARFISKVAPYTNKINGFWKKVSENYPDISTEELYSGMYHIVFKKN